MLQYWSQCYGAVWINYRILINNKIWSRVEIILGLMFKFLMIAHAHAVATGTCTLHTRRRAVYCGGSAEAGSSMVSHTVSLSLPSTQNTSRH